MKNLSLKSIMIAALLSTLVACGGESKDEVVVETPPAAEDSPPTPVTLKPDESSTEESVTPDLLQVTHVQQPKIPNIRVDQSITKSDLATQALIASIQVSDEEKQSTTTELPDYTIYEPTCDFIGGDFKDDSDDEDDPSCFE